MADERLALMAHLLRRAGFGTTREELEAYAARPYEDVVEELIHPERMPDLEDRATRESLRQRITFANSDWADLPLESKSVDAIFATNALPRESSAEQLRVLKEWIRVVRPSGLVFIAQHNFFDSDVGPTLRDAGWEEANILGGERPTQLGAAGFEMFYSSG